MVIVMVLSSDVNGLMVVGINTIVVKFIVIIVKDLSKTPICVI